MLQHKAARLRQYDDKRSLSHESGFSCHVRSGNKQELVTIAVHLDIIGDKTAGMAYSTTDAFHHG